MITMNLYPNPRLVGTADSPPPALLDKHVPELAPRHAKVRAALQDAQQAQDTLGELAPHRPGMTPGGSLWVEAERRDVEAVEAGQPATAVGDVIRAHPNRVAQAYATATVAARAVQEWNGRAHRDVKPATIKTLQAQVRDAHQDAISAAARTLVAADQAGSDRNQRLHAGWKGLTDLDAALDRWRTAHHLLAWCNGNKWETPQESERPGEEVIARALSLRDESLRSYFLTKDGHPQVPTVQRTS